MYKIIEFDIEKNSYNDDVKILALFLAAISSIILKEMNQSFQFLQLIGNLDSKTFPVKWDFSDIKHFLTNLENNKQLFLDVIAFYEGETSFPIVRPEDIQILEEEKELNAKVYHPFAGFLTISVTDVELVELLQQINESQITNFDMPNIMDLERKKALLMLGFLSKKEICEVQSLEGQKYKLELTKNGSRLLKSILISAQHVSQS